MKFSPLSTAVIGGAATLALAACAPPHQVDSDKKINTAHTTSTPTNNAPHHVSASEPPQSSKVTGSHNNHNHKTTTSPTVGTATNDSNLPMIINCENPSIQTPASLTLACGSNNDRLVNITWNSWTPTEAIGTATREINTCLPNCVDGKIESIPGVHVRLIAPTTTPQGAVFTQLFVNDTPAAF